MTLENHRKFGDLGPDPAKSLNTCITLKFGGVQLMPMEQNPSVTLSCGNLYFLLQSCLELRTEVHETETELKKNSTNFFQTLKNNQTKAMTERSCQPFISSLVHSYLVINSKRVEFK